MISDYLSRAKTLISPFNICLTFTRSSIYWLHFSSNSCYNDSCFFFEISISSIDWAWVRLKTQASSSNSNLLSSTLVSLASKSSFPFNKIYFYLEYTAKVPSNLHWISLKSPLYFLLDCLSFNSTKFFSFLIYSKAYLE